MRQIKPVEQAFALAVVLAVQNLGKHTIIEHMDL